MCEEYTCTNDDCQGQALELGNRTLCAAITRTHLNFLPLFQPGAVLGMGPAMSAPCPSLMHALHAGRPGCPARRVGATRARQHHRYAHTASFRRHAGPHEQPRPMYQAHLVQPLRGLQQAAPGLPGPGP